MAANSVKANVPMCFLALLQLLSICLFHFISLVIVIPRECADDTTRIMLHKIKIGDTEWRTLTGKNHKVCLGNIKLNQLR